MAQPLEQPQPESPPEAFGFPLDQMTNEQKLDEVLYQLRTVASALAAFQNLGPAGVMKMLMGGKK